MGAIYEKLQFTNVIDASVEDKKLLGIDKIYKSGEFTTVAFKEVDKFDEKTLKDIAQIHHNLWNYKKILFLYVTSKTEIKVYNCTAKPFNYKNDKNIQKELKEIELVNSDINNLDKLFEIFSAPAIDSGSIWIRNNDYVKKIKIDKRVDSFLIESLIKTAKELEKQGLDLDIVHSLIMRSLFIMYLEDKGATPKEFYTKEKQHAKSYFDLLEDREATYSFFEKIKDNFNGNVFPVTNKEKDTVNIYHLELIKRCFTNGDIKGETLFKDWRIFKFNIIQIELLSEIYEQFLGKIQKETGSYYTPPALVELILNEVLPINNNEKKYNLKILDPTCGSGIFLVEAYKRIVKRWQNAHPDKKIDFKTLKELLLNSIYGIELNHKSIKVASFSLYLSMLEFLNPKNLWYLDGEKFPYLINDEEDESIKIQGNNLFRADAIEDNKKFEKQYDLIIGNPPYGKSKIPKNIKDYCKKYNFSQEFVIPFMHKATILAPKGKIALLATTKLLTNTSGTSQNFRRWLFNKNYVEKVYNLSILRKTPKNFGGNLFSSATVPASIFFFQKETPLNKSKTIEYWAPKTYVKSSIADGVIIDSSDIKYLPRDECQKPDTKIWKITQWGTINDYILIQNLNKLDILDKYFNNEEFGGGFQPKTNDNKNSEIKKLPFLDTKDLELYYTNKQKTKKINYVSFERLGTFNAYKAPHLLLKEGITKNKFNSNKDYRIISSFIDYNCSFKKGIIGIHYHNTKILKALVCYFNSNFFKYLMFLISASWGIERDVIKSNEILIPDFFKNSKIVDLLVEYFSQLKNDDILINNNILKIENKINNEIYSYLNLSNDEQTLIDDTIRYTIDLFHKGYKSIALKPLDTKELELYAKKLCEKINNILKDSNIKLIANVYVPSYYNPLSLIKFHFVDKNSKQTIKTINTTKEFNSSLSKLNKFTLNQYSKSIYVQKNITYYDDDLIYIIKPNQKRFWTQSQAIEDAQNIALEIMSMNNE